MIFLALFQSNREELTILKHSPSRTAETIIFHFAVNARRLRSRLIGESPQKRAKWSHGDLQRTCKLLINDNFKIYSIVF